MKSGDPEHEKHNTSHGKEMIMKELRIAIIGCGMISHRHMTVRWWKAASRFRQPGPSRT